MVYWFDSVDPASGKTYQLYMGKDKVENEELIAHGREGDVWFHVNDLSSAHVYLRLDQTNYTDAVQRLTKPNSTSSSSSNSTSDSISSQASSLLNQSFDIKTCIPTSVLIDCAQLTKANSIIGNKKETGKVKIVYTEWSNLLKTKGMECGQVGFKSMKKLLYTDVLTRENSIINRLMKTRVELPSNSIKESGEKYLQQRRVLEKCMKKSLVEEEKKVIENRRKEKEERSYDGLFVSENMMSNAELAQSAEQFEDDFM